MKGGSLSLCVCVCRASDPPKGGDMMRTDGLGMDCFDILFDRRTTTGCPKSVGWQGGE